MLIALRIWAALFSRIRTRRAGDRGADCGLRTTGTPPPIPVRPSMQNNAVVVGAFGVIGRYIVERLVKEPDWRVVGLSRRKTTDGPQYHHVAVDLLDLEDTERKLAELTDVTHVFYTAFQASSGSAADFASNTGPNREMLVNRSPPSIAPRLI